MSNPGPDESFVRNLTGCQNRLYAYVSALIPDRDKAEEVLQNANVEMWKNAHNFTPGTDFGAWACSMAYFAVLSYRRDRDRDRLVFDDDVMEQLATHAGERPAQWGPRADALSECMETLPQADSALIARRYGDEATIGELATDLGNTPGAVGTRLYRIRLKLLDCVEGKLAAGGER